ncbi:MAG: ATP-binding protein [Bacteroidota bacterium]
MNSLQLFVQHMPAAVAMMDTSLRYIMASSRWASDFDLHLLSLKGKAHTAHFDDPTGFWAATFADVLEGELLHGEGATIARTGGETYWIGWEMRPWYDGDDQIGGLIMFAEDKTAQKRSEEALRTSEANLRALFNNSVQSFVLLDLAGQVQAVNSVAQMHTQAMFGRVPQVGASFYDVMPDEDAASFRADFDRAVDGGTTVQERRYRLGKHEVWYELSKSPVYDQDHDVIGVCFSAVDITDRKQVERERMRYTHVLEQRNQELQDFAYVASHDLQEPLRKIRAFTDLIAEDHGEQLSGEGPYYLERVGEAATRMSRLLSDLLAFSRVATHGRAFEPVDLNEVMVDVLSDLEYRIQETQAKVYVRRLPTVEADPSQMHQLLQNLVSNALKFSPPDQAPHVEVGLAETAQAAADTVEVSVRDHGIGFAPKYADRIFSPFRRLHGRNSYPGTGMGLAICRRIVSRHHGTIRAEGVPGEGATFIIALPIVQEIQPTPS